MKAIRRALELAEPDGAVPPFALVPVGDLLRATRVTAPLMPACRRRSWTCWPDRHRRSQLTLEELSEAELRVLRFLPTNLKAPEIASEL